jgi:MFS family permease
MFRSHIAVPEQRRKKHANYAPPSPANAAELARISAIIFVTIALSSVIFQSTGFALPKIFEERLPAIAGSATVVGWLAFLVFAIASAAQLLTGLYLDRVGPRAVFMVAASIQVIFFMLMPGLTNWPALLVALAFMLGAFGQVPITDYMVGKMARDDNRSAVYGARYVVTFVVFASTIPLIAWVHSRWGFDTLFRLLSLAAALIFLGVSLLPKKLPEPEPEPAPASG